MQEGWDEEGFAVDVKADMNRYKEALIGILGDVYTAKPEMAPRLHILIHRCEGVLALTEKVEAKKISPHDARELISRQVDELKRMTEEFLEDLSSSLENQSGEEPYYTGSAS